MRGRSSRWEVGREIDVSDECVLLLLVDDVDDENEDVDEVEDEVGWITCTLLLVLTCLMAHTLVSVQRCRYSVAGLVVALEGRDDLR